MSSSFGLSNQNADKAYKNLAVKDTLTAGRLVANAVYANTVDLQNLELDDLTVQNNLVLSDFTENSVLFVGPAGLVTEDTAFTWTDSTNNLQPGSVGVSIGVNAGLSTNGVAVGTSAGQTAQATLSVAIGNNAGASTQAASSVAIGSNAGQTAQATLNVAIGSNAGASTQATGSVAIGSNAGRTSQATLNVAIGSNAGALTQATFAVAIGSNAGQTGQTTQAVAIGADAGSSGQLAGAVAIGYRAGQTGQQANAIAIGNLAGQSGQFAGSIVICATGTALNPTQAGFHVNPVRTAAIAANSVTLTYVGANNEIVVNSSKTFVIDHPLTPETDYLVHACLEGPEAGVYYRGEVTIPMGETSATVALPSYVPALATDFSVGFAPKKHFVAAAVSDVEVKTGTFTLEVAAPALYPLSFFWHVFGKRQAIQSEVSKATVKKVGDGPYVYLEKL